jgi:hypothetical protein
MLFGTLENEEDTKINSRFVLPKIITIEIERRKLDLNNQKGFVATYNLVPSLLWALDHHKKSIRIYIDNLWPAYTRLTLDFGWKFMGNVKGHKT